ncbi:MAG: hypothetical protein RIS66_1257 [Actinomycetota bacterium]|jgi:hypothetical protein
MIKFAALAAGASIALISLTGCTSETETASPAPSTSASASKDAAANSSEPATAPEVTTQPKAPVVDKGIATADATAEQLVYLIEEEKLAHDVYSKMFELWGSKVFGNILNSEESHQSQVLTVMATRDIADPRSSQEGVFKNADLQKLYDELIAKGSKSAVDAYEVGVAIEVLDIDDLTKMLATAKDADVIAMMENLRRGSENHLRAFNNQLNK